MLLLVCVGCSEISTRLAATQNPDDAGPHGDTQDQSEIPDPYPIRITGRNMHWHVQYADAVGRNLFTGDGQPLREIHVPENTNVVLVLNSADYIYTLTLQQFGIKEIAVPDLECSVALPASDAGIVEFAGEELCGQPNPALQGHLIVEPHDRFLQWLHDTSAAADD